MAYRSTTGLTERVRVLPVPHRWRFVAVLLLMHVAYLSLAPHALGEPTAYEALHEKYKSARAAIDEETLTGIESARKAYGEGLSRVAQACQEAGELEAVLAVRQEIKRFEDSGTVPAPSHSVQRVLTIQQDFRKERDRITNETNRKRASLIKHYLRRLVSLKKELTRRNRIEEALALRDEIEERKAELYALESALEKALPPTRPTVHGRTKWPPEEYRGSLILHFGFNRKDEKSVEDLSGNEHNGRVHGATWTIGGKRGGGCSFDGKNDHVVLSPPFKHFDQGTIMCWVKLDDWKKPDQDIVSWTSWAVHFGLGIDSKGRLQSQMDGPPSGVILSSDRNQELNGWHHVAVSFKEMESFRLYLDGERIGSRKGNNPYRGKGDILIGARRDKGMHAKGAIDEVMFFKRQLEDDDILRLYKASAAR